MRCLIERLMTLEVVIELKHVESDDWNGTEVVTYTPMLTTKAAFVNDSTTKKIEILPAIITGYTENKHVVYIPYSDIPKEGGEYTLRVDGMRYPIEGVLNMSALNRWTELVLSKGEPVT